MRETDRLRMVCDYLLENSFVKSKAQIARDLGYKYPQVLWNLFNSDAQVPLSVLVKLSVVYPMINTGWIRSGKGSMLNEPGSFGDDVGRKKMERFMKYIYASNINIKDALSMLGWNRRTYERALREDLDDAQVTKVTETFKDLNREWLVLGSGRMIRESQEYIVDVVMKLKEDVMQLKVELSMMKDMIKNMEKSHPEGNR